MDIDQSKIPKPPVDSASEKTRCGQLLSHYGNLIRKESYCVQVLEELKKGPRVQALKDQWIITGTGAVPLNAQILAPWYLWAIHEYGVEAANTNLNKFLDSETIFITGTLWVLGIEVQQSIELENGISIIPIENMPYSPQKELFLEKNYRLSAISKLITPKAAITQLCKIQKTAGPAVAKRLFQLRQSLQCLTDTALLLNALDDVSCLPFHLTTYSLPEMPLGIFGSYIGRGYFHDVFGDQSSCLPTSKLSIINDLINQFSALSPKDKTRMNRVLSRLSQAKRKNQIEDKILDLGIALEMVLLDDNTNNEQLSSTFRLRGSWLIGEDYESRQTVHGQLKEIYKYRSQVAHTGELCRNVPQKKQVVTNNFSTYVHLAEKIIRRIIHQPDINWTETVLGNK